MNSSADPLVAAPVVAWLEFLLVVLQVITISRRTEKREGKYKMLP